MKKSLFWTLMGASVLILAACGGGGGSGGTGTTVTTFSGATTAATIDADNSDELAIAAASGAKQALSADNSNSPLRPADNSAFDTIMKSFKSQVSKAIIGNAAKGLAHRTESLTASICNAGGSAIATYPDSYSTSYSWSATFTDCTYSYSGVIAVYNGTMYGTSSQSGDISTSTFSYSNFTIAVTYLGSTETYTLNYSETCTTNTSTYDTSCDVHSDFTGFDNRTYRVSDASVSGDNSSGYNINATVYDPDYGYFTITASNVTFCNSGFPGSGSVSYTDGSSSVTVDFLSCTQYQYTYGGMTYGPFTW